MASLLNIPSFAWNFNPPRLFITWCAVAVVYGVVRDRPVHHAITYPNHWAWVTLITVGGLYASYQGVF